MAIKLSDHFRYRKLIRFTLPTMAMMIITSIYSVVDGFFVSNFAGKTPFAAINLIMPFLMILSTVGLMFGTGGSAIVAKTSAGALNYTPVAKVTNLSATMKELKEKGLWFVCADMGGEVMYRQNLTGPIGLVIGNEGEGVSKLVRENCDFITSIPMQGDIDSLNASVAAGVLAYEIVRQRLGQK